MPKTKTRINKKSKNTRKRKSAKKSLYKLKGGIGEELGLPPCNILAQFEIKDNCVVISVELAKEYAFRLGRDPQAPPGALGDLGEGDPQGRGSQPAPLRR